MQIRVLEYLAEEIRANGRVPTIRDIASHLGHRTTSSAQLHVTNLEKAGYLIRQGGHRSLRLLRDSNDQPFHNSGFDLGQSNKPIHKPTHKTRTASGSQSAPQSVFDEHTDTDYEHVGLRLAGVVAAGQPIETIQQDEWIDLGSMYDDNHYVLRVRGDSMIEDHIADGDMVVIKRQTVCSDGDMVVARIDGEATLKRFYREKAKRRIRLEPANKAMKPLYRTNVEIDGVVVGVIRVMGG